MKPERSGDSRRQNQCHHVPDVTSHEDHCQVCSRTAAENLTLVREIATKFLKASPAKTPCAANENAPRSTRASAKESPI